MVPAEAVAVKEVVPAPQMVAGFAEAELIVGLGCTVMVTGVRAEAHPKSSA